MFPSFWLGGPRMVTGVVSLGLALTRQFALGVESKLPGG